MLHEECRKRHRSALPFDGAAFAGLDPMTIKDRRIVAAGRRRKAIGKPRHDVAGRRLVQIDGNAPTLMQDDGPEIVDAVRLIGVLVGQKNRVEMVDLVHRSTARADPGEVSITTRVVP